MTNLLNELQNLLEKQIKLVHQGSLAGRQMELLSKQAGCIVEKILHAGIFPVLSKVEGNEAEFKNQREHLCKLYQRLNLAITEQKADLAEKISRLRKVKQTIGAYRKYM